MNTIDTAQNTARSIDLHAAKSHYYLGVAWVQRVQLVLLVLNAISWPILIYWKPDLKVYSALAAIVLPLLEILLLECIQKNWKSTAAKIQEVFDCDVLGLPWNTFKVGDRPNEEDIALGVQRFAHSRGDREMLMRWYEFDFSDLPVEHARLICQRANAWWDSELRNYYAFTIPLVTVLIVVSAISVGVIAGLHVETLILAIGAPLSPIVMWLIRETIKQNAAASDGKRVVRHLDSIIAKVIAGHVDKTYLDSEARLLQDEIYERRRSQTVNSQWLYWRKRDLFQDRMKAAGKQKIDEMRTAALRKSS